MCEKIPADDLSEALLYKKRPHTNFWLTRRNSERDLDVREAVFPFAATAGGGRGKNAANPVCAEDAVFSAMDGCVKLGGNVVEVRSIC